MNKKVYHISEFSDMVHKVGGFLEPVGSIKETLYINKENGNILKLEELLHDPEIEMEMESDIENHFITRELRFFKIDKYQHEESLKKYAIRLDPDKYVPITVISIAAVHYNNTLIQNIWTVNYNMVNEVINNLPILYFLIGKFTSENSEKINSININKYQKD